MNEAGDQKSLKSSTFEQNQELTHDNVRKLSGKVGELNGPQISNKVVAAVGGVMAVTAVVGAAEQKGVNQEIGDSIKDLSTETLNMAIDTVDAVKVPVDKSVDIFGNIIPDNKPVEARIPNKILLGDIEIKITDKLYLRTSPSVMGKSERPNEVSWDAVNLANKKVVNNQVVLQPIEYKMGDTLTVRNPEIVIGQFTGGGNGIGEKSYWIQLYQADGQPVYINFQAETSEFVREVKENPADETRYSTATTIQNAQGLNIVQYDIPAPQTTSALFVNSSE